MKRMTKGCHHGRNSGAGGVRTFIAREKEQQKNNKHRVRDLEHSDGMGAAVYGRSTRGCENGLAWARL